MANVTIIKILNEFYPCKNCKYYSKCEHFNQYFPIRRKNRKHLENVKHRGTRSAPVILGTCEDFTNVS